MTVSPLNNTYQLYQHIQNVKDPHRPIYIVFPHETRSCKQGTLLNAPSVCADTGIVRRVAALRHMHDVVTCGELMAGVLSHQMSGGGEACLLTLKGATWAPTCALKCAVLFAQLVSFPPDTVVIGQTLRSR
jgi:hypothetical protein